MIPGLGNMDPRQMAAMMKRAGIEMRDIANVQEVVVRTATRDYVFSKAAVSVMKAQGQETWQVVGTPRVVEKATTSSAAPNVAPGVAVNAPAPPSVAPSTAAPPTAFTITDEDVKTVMQGANCDAKTARQALQATGGDLAEAIVKLTG